MDEQYAPLSLGRQFLRHDIHDVANAFASRGRCKSYDAIPEFSLAVDGLKHRSDQFKIESHFDYLPASSQKFGLTV